MGAYIWVSDARGSEEKGNGRWEWDDTAGTIGGDRDSGYAGGAISGNDAWNKIVDDFTTASEGLESGIGALTTGGQRYRTTQDGMGLSALQYFNPKNPKNLAVTYHPEDPTNLWYTLVQPDGKNGIKETDYHGGSMGLIDYLPMAMMALVGGAAVAGAGAGGAAGSAAAEGAGAAGGSAASTAPGMFEGTVGGLDAGSIALDTAGNLGAISGAVPGAATSSSAGLLDAWDLMGNPEAYGMNAAEAVGGLDAGNIALDTAGNLSSISGAVPATAIPYKDIARLAQSLLKGGGTSAQGTQSQSGAGVGAGIGGGGAQVHNTTPGMTQAPSIIPQQQQIQPTQMAELSQPNFQFSGYQQISPGVQGQQVGTVSPFGQDSEIQKIAKALKEKKWQMN